MEEKAQAGKNKNLILLIAGIVVVIAIALLFVIPKTSPVVEEGGVSEEGEIAEEEITEGEMAEGEGEGEAFSLQEDSTSPVNEEGTVVVPGTGEPVKYDVDPGSPEAPQQSAPVDPGQVSQEAIKIKISREEGYNPSEFTVTAGQLITLSISSGDNFAHVFKFRDPALKAVAVGVGPDETRNITFNAPSRGEYEFYCDIPGHPSVGKMIVK
jgi:plastocyanin